MQNVKMKKIILKPDERIVAVRPETITGPGWKNQLVAVGITNEKGRYREEYLQPEEQTILMRQIFRISEEMTTLMFREALSLTVTSEDQSEK